MASRVPRFYWDSNVILTFLNAYEAARVQTIEALLYRASQGVIEILTSTLTLVEVAFIRDEYDAGDLPEGVDERISSLWYPSGPIKLVDLQQSLAERARGLVRRAAASGGGIDPRDAVHLASAMYVNAPVVHTYEKKLHRQAGDLGLEITEPTGEATQLPLPPTT